MPTQTPNFGFNAPTVYGDNNVWGGFLNENWAQIDSLLQEAAAYPDLASLQAAALAGGLPANASRVACLGHTEPGDGGEVVYVKVGLTEPSHTFKFQDINLTWWGIFPTHGIMRPQYAGGFIETATAVDNGIALQLCADYFGDSIEGIVQMPPGRFPITTNPVSELSSGEGDIVMLNTNHYHPTFRGHGAATVLLPATNKCVLFSSYGNQALTLRDFVVDNTANGRLLNSDKANPRLRTPNGGIAGYGNGANSVVIQHLTASTYVYNVETREMNTLAYHWGAGPSQAILEGDVDVSGCKMIGGCFMLFAAQPRRIVFNNNYGEDIVHSTTPQDNTPGHMVYVGNRQGAFPEMVSMNDNQCLYCTSSPLKCNKAWELSITNFAFRWVAGGIELRRIFKGSVTGGSMSYNNPQNYTNAEMIQATSCGNVTISDIVTDLRPSTDAAQAPIGTTEVAWGARIAEDDGSNQLVWMSRGVTLENLKFILDPSTVGQNKAVIVMNDHNRGVVRDCEAVCYGDTQPGRPFIDLANSSRCRIINPILRDIGFINWDDVVRFQADTDRCHVEFDEQNFANITTSNINDQGTLNTITNRTILCGTFDPDLGAENDDDVSLSTITRSGEWQQIGEWIHYNMYLSATVQYTTANGGLRLNWDIPFTPNGATNQWAASLGDIRQAAFGVTPPVVTALSFDSNPYVSFRVIGDTAGGTSLKITDIPKGAQFIVSVSGKFRRAY